MSYTNRKILEFLFGETRVQMLSPTIGYLSGGKKVSYSVSIPGLEKSDFSKFVWRLRRTDWVEFKEEDDGKIRLVLTESGKKKILVYQFDEMEIKKPKHWDGRWRIVAFDIPEGKKAARNALGSKMKSLGLLPFQKSLWVYPYDCKNEIDFVAGLYGVGKYVHYIVTHSITNDDLLRQRFDLINL